MAHPDIFSIESALLHEIKIARSNMISGQWLYLTSSGVHVTRTGTQEPIPKAAPQYN